MAAKRAEIRRLSNAEPLYSGPNRYGSMQLQIKASLLAQVAVDKFDAPCLRDSVLKRNLFPGQDTCFIGNQ